MRNQRTEDIRHCLYELEQSAISRDDKEDQELVQRVLKHINDQEQAILNFWGRPWKSDK